ncbi:hypothetical protein V2J09_004389 [Rumex salicifolius]
MAFRNWKPVLVILLINFIFAISNVLLKAALAEGLNHLVIVTYRQTASALFLGPLAYCLERATITQYLYLMGLQLTSVTFSSAFINMMPVCTFLMALLFRQEKLKVKSISGKAKITGSVVCVGGIVLLALYRGFPLSRCGRSQGSGSGSKKSSGDMLGSILYTTSIIMWSSWFLIQGKVCKIYPSKYSSTAILSSFSAVQSAVLCVALNRDITIWVLHGKLQITSVLFSGIVLSGLCYVGMAWCVEQKGAVFTAAFSPFMQIFVSFFDLTFLHEQIFFGSIVGSVLVGAGLYILLWGKSKETEHVAAPEMKPLEAGALTNSQADNRLASSHV